MNLFLRSFIHSISITSVTLSFPKLSIYTFPTFATMHYDPYKQKDVLRVIVRTRFNQMIS